MFRRAGGKRLVQPRANHTANWRSILAIAPWLYKMARCWHNHRSYGHETRGFSISWLVSWPKKRFSSRGLFKRSHQKLPYCALPYEPTRAGDDKRRGGDGGRCSRQPHAGTPRAVAHTSVERVAPVIRNKRSKEDLST